MCRDGFSGPLSSTSGDDEVPAPTKDKMVSYRSGGTPGRGTTHVPEGNTSAPSSSALQLGAPMRREVIPPHPQASVRVLTHDFPSEICGWGYHPEYEIHLITKTRGSFIAGDHIGTFAPGHVSMMGPNLPHDWVSDLADGQVAVDRDAVIQFSDEWVHCPVQPNPDDFCPSHVG